jgi:hypothetical protein
VPVDESRIREIFAEEKILERAAAGELATRISYDQPAPATTNFPPGTRSQRKQYRDATTRKKVAETHFYRLPSGKIGASGMEDPKEVVQNDTLYYFRR